MHGGTASLWKIVKALETKIRRHDKRSTISIFAITDPLLLPKAGMEQVRLILRSSIAISTYAVSDGDLRDCFFLLFWERRLLPTFLWQLVSAVF